MYEFLEYIKAYLQTCFDNDNDFTASKKPKLIDSYKINHEPKMTQPEIQVQIMDDSENMAYTTFCGKRTDSTPLQISAFSGQMKIGGIDKNAQHSSIIIADKIKKYLYELIYSDDKENMLTGRHITSSPALPMNDGGSIYMSAVRFDFDVQTEV